MPYVTNNYPAPYGAGSQFTLATGVTTTGAEYIWGQSVPPGSMQSLQAETRIMNNVTGYVAAKEKMEALSNRYQEQQQLHWLRQSLSCEQIRPLDHSRGQISGFSFEGVPSDLIDLVRDLAYVTGWPVQELFLMLLAAINAALRGRFRVQIDPTWTEPLLLFVGCYAASGGRKSQVLDLLTGPLKAFEADLQMQYRQEHPSRQLEQRLCKQAQDQRLRQYVKEFATIPDSELSGCIAEATKQLAAIGQETTLPSFPGIFGDSYTDLGLVRLMEQNAGGLAIMLTECRQFMNQMSDPKFNLDVVLKGHTMESHTHKSARGEAIHLQNPFLSILLVTQPDIAVQLYAKEKLVASGLAARFLPCFLPCTCQAEVLYPGIGFDFDKRYNNKIMSMLRRYYTQDGNRGVHTIGVTHEARAVLKKFEQEMADLMCRSDSLPHASFLRKVHGTAARIAGILHCFRHDEPETVKIAHQDAQTAVCIARSTIPAAAYSFAPNGLRAMEDARKISDWVKRHNVVEDDARKVSQQCSIRSMDRVNNALDLLEQHNHIRQLLRKSGGRVFVVHPGLCSQR